jgi:hypothetical protein
MRISFPNWKRKYLNYKNNLDLNNSKYKITKRETVKINLIDSIKALSAFLKCPGTTVVGTYLSTEKAGPLTPKTPQALRLIT